MNGASLAEKLKGNRQESISRRPDAPTSTPNGNVAARTAGLASLPGASMISIDRIIPDADQPRKEFEPEALQRLADSMRDRGQLQPIRVRWSDSAGHYVVVVGERRWRASELAGMKSIACVIVQGGASPEDLLLDQLVENAIREDLKPVEQARAYKTLMDARGWSLRELADHLRVHFTGVQKALTLLDLSPEVQEVVDDGRLAASTAQAIAANIDDPAEQREVAARVVSEGLNRADAVELVRQVASKPRAGGSKASKGRGAFKGKVKLPTERTIRTEAGPRVTVEYRKGVDDAVIVSALREILARLEGAGDQARIEAEQGGETAAA